MFGDVRDVNDVDVRRMLMASLRETLRESLRKIGLKSDTYIDSLINEMLKLDVNDVDIEKYNFWFSYWVKELNQDKITSLGRYFYRVFEKQLTSGTFKKTSNTSTQQPVNNELSSVEDFEKEWDTWCDVVRGLSLNPEMPDSPSLGVLAVDIGNRVRGVSTGDGGFVYIDGTESQRFKKFEDLTNQEQEDLCAAVERLHGNLRAKDSILQQMRQLMGGSQA